MLDWASIRPQLVAWLVAGLGIDSKAIFVENTPRGFTSSRTAILKVTRVANDPGFRDEVGQEQSGDAFVQVVRGRRTILATIEVWTNAQTASGIADNLLERLRTLHNVDRLRSILASCNVAVASIGPSVQGDVEVDQRMFSVWSCEVDFNYAFEHTDTAETDASIIEAVSGTGETQPNGEEPTFFVDVRE